MKCIVDGKNVSAVKYLLHNLFYQNKLSQNRDAVCHSLKGLLKILIRITFKQHFFIRQQQQQYYIRQNCFLNCINTNQSA